MKNPKCRNSPFQAETISAEPYAHIFLVTVPHLSPSSHPQHQKLPCSPISLPHHTRTAASSQLPVTAPHLRPSSETAAPTSIYTSVCPSSQIDLRRKLPVTGPRHRSHRSISLPHRSTHLSAPHHRSSPGRFSVGRICQAKVLML
ncbi:hypothetical protein RchiOBHm_Chr2g0162801 [Rosa chinensis]|uniref:Uncharacterized protein n=1 Tax=Rosa chinensis TaxID=74649 RepID=A0A2P6S355_ROSCH|nr:hypothetical protein RchiOBHm_Chr2g0162801 [Rosa chinensis]